MQLPQVKKLESCFSCIFSILMDNDWLTHLFVFLVNKSHSISKAALPRPWIFTIWLTMVSKLLCLELWWAVELHKSCALHVLAFLCMYKENLCEWVFLEGFLVAYHLPLHNFPRIGKAIILQWSLWMVYIYLSITPPEVSDKLEI